ncbi:MAG: nucleoside kinase [Bacilli bacterium]|nr:nucleoside kinase [Bacilli bacterium]
MNEKMVKVNFNGILIKEFPVGTTIKAISKKFQSYFSYPILIAKLDNDLVELSDTITKKCDINFYDRSSMVGNSVYGRTLQFIAIVAVKRVFGKEAELHIEHSIDKGFYCELSVDSNKESIDLLEKTMHDIVNEDLAIQKISVIRSDAIKYFKKEKQMDKVRVLKYISNSYINLYSIDNVYDYFYGDLAFSTKAIDEFKVQYIKDKGFVINFPDIYNPEVTLDYKHHKMLFDKFYEYNEWCRCQSVINAADLNERVSSSKVDELIRISETYYNNQLEKIAEDIKAMKQMPRIILLAGPSSSGKTTTSKKLEMHLRLNGIKTVQISVDNYFLNRNETPKDNEGNYDYESIYAIDITLFNKHLNKLLANEKVLMPRYDFISGEKYYKDDYLQIDDNTILIIEGLHSLNDELTMSIERNLKYKIYISPLTQLNIDNHNRIHTSDTRKLRRIIRDNRTRGYSATDTLNMWKKIREGEEKWIFPYQDDADIIINSALIYELGVLKTYVEPLLFSVNEEDPVYPEALRLINFLRNFLPIPSEDIPQDSVLREFIGNGCYKV